MTFLTNSNNREVLKKIGFKQLSTLKMPSRADFYAEFSGADEKPILLSNQAPHASKVKIKRHVRNSADSGKNTSGRALSKNRPHIHAPSIMGLPDATSRMAPCKAAYCVYFQKNRNGANFQKMLTCVVVSAARMTTQSESLRKSNRFN